MTSGQIPIFLRWLQWINLFKFGFTALAIKEFHNREFYCTEQELLRHGVKCPIIIGALTQKKISFKIT